MANHKRIRRLLREHDLRPCRRWRYIVTTDSAHDLPIFPDLTKGFVLTGPDQLWVADLTYVAITGGFAYVAIILDAWSRKVVDYAIGRSIDARLAMAALKVALESRRPPPGLIRHSDRGSQYAALACCEILTAHEVVGSMSRRGNPYDNAKAESFMKTLKVEAVYPMALKPSRTSPLHFRASSITFTIIVASILRWAISAPHSSRKNTPAPWSNQPHRFCPTRGAHSIWQGVSSHRLRG